jgi:hypothetical protein
MNGTFGKLNPDRRPGSSQPVIFLQMTCRVGQGNAASFPLGGAADRARDRQPSHRTRPRPTACSYRRSQAGRRVPTVRFMSSRYSRNRCSHWRSGLGRTAHARDVSELDGTGFGRRAGGHGGRCLATPKLRLAAVADFISRVCFRAVAPQRSKGQGRLGLRGGLSALPRPLMAQFAIPSTKRRCAAGSCATRPGLTSCA